MLQQCCAAGKAEITRPQPGNPKDDCLLCKVMFQACAQIAGTLLGVGVGKVFSKVSRCMGSCKLARQDAQTYVQRE
jgi:hypothetical protein